MEKNFGKWGESLWNKSQGIGSTVVETDWEQKSMSHENTFDEDKTDVTFLHSEIVRLTEKTAYSLREDEKLTGCLTVKSVIRILKPSRGRKRLITPHSMIS
ncbi:MAG: hypothetical protein WDO19_12505 [Bacteroidota bacterium]